MTPNSTTEAIDTTNAGAVARALLDGAEVQYGYPDDSKLERRVALRDGRVATLRVRFDDSAGIGKWIERYTGKVESHKDDVFGVFCFRGTDRDTGLPGERPAGFDGRARVLRPRDHGARIGESVWWQPPADVEPEHLPELESTVRAYLERGAWEHVGLIVGILEHGEEVGRASVWSVEWGTGDDSHVVELVSELLEESGFDRPSTAAVVPYLRDIFEAVARRMSGEDGDDDPAPAYDSALRSLLAWYFGHVEGEEWDTYGDPLASRIHADYLQHVAQTTNTESDA